MLTKQALAKATDIVARGGVIAYPTEGVYGLGCDPFNQLAVEKILTLKQRDVAQGLIIIAADWQQVQALTLTIPTFKLEEILQSRDQPVTWLFPASAVVPKWICGDFATVALRITKHPPARQLCEATGPLVSTSANIHRQASAKTAADVEQIFAEKIDLILDAPTGGLQKPTPIINVLDGTIIRH